MQVVLIPGLLCDRAIWAAQIEALARRGVAVDVADVSRQATLTEMAEDALALAEGPLVVIGHSMGARAALEAVRLAPERVARLALLDTGIHTRREGEAEKRYDLVDLADRDGMDALADSWLPPMVHEARWGDAALMGGLRAMVGRATPASHRRQIEALLNRPDPRPFLSAITCPTLVLVGRQDRWSPPEQNREIAAAIPGAEFVVIEDSGHMTPAERPEAVSRALLHWLGLEDDAP